jgi:hypothetical protein
MRKENRDMMKVRHIAMRMTATTIDFRCKSGLPRSLEYKAIENNNKAPT